MAELLGGTTIAGYPVLHSGLKEAYLDGKLTVNGLIQMGVGNTKGIDGKDGLPILVDHDNGNVTLSATGGQLYLGYTNTTTVRLMQNLVYGTGSLIADISGKLYYQTDDIDTRYLKLTGGTMSGTLTANKGVVFGDTFTDVSGSMYYKSSTSEMRVKQGSTWGTVLDSSNYTTTLDNTYVRLNGSNDMTGNMTISRTGGQLLTLKQTDYTSGGGGYNYIGFADNTGQWKSYIGYGSARNGHFNVNSSTGNIVLSPADGFKIDMSNSVVANTLNMEFNSGGAIKVTDGTTLKNAITFTGVTGNTSGYGVRLGAGGLTVVGGGEAVDTAYNGYIADDSANRNAATEQLLLASDNAVYVHTNLGSGWSDVAGTSYKSTFTFHDYGYLILPGGRGNGNPTSTTPGGRVLDMGNGYNWYQDNTGSGTDNTRLWLDGPNQGEFVVGPRGSSYILDQIRLRGNHIWLETDGTDTAAGNRKGVTIGASYNTGQHLQLDSNEIASFSGTTASTLYLNPDGGDLRLGSAASHVYITPGDETSLKITNTNTASGTIGNAGLEIRAEGGGTAYLDFVRGDIDYTQRLSVDSSNKLKLVPNGSPAKVVDAYEESSVSVSTGGWYDIAYNGTQYTPAIDTGGDRAIATFYVDGAMAGRHDSIIYVAGTAFGQTGGMNINVIGFTKYNGADELIGGIRIVYGGTYSTQYLQMYFQPGADYNIRMKDNHWNKGWTLLYPPRLGTIPTGYSSYMKELQGGYANIPRTLLSGTGGPPSQGSAPGDIYIQY